MSAAHKTRKSNRTKYLRLFLWQTVDWWSAFALTQTNTHSHTYITIHPVFKQNHHDDQLLCLGFVEHNLWQLGLANICLLRELLAANGTITSCLSGAKMELSKDEWLIVRKETHFVMTIIVMRWQSQVSCRDGPFVLRDACGNQKRNLFNSAKRLLV